MNRESKELSVEEFSDKVFGDITGAITISLCSIGDKLGLFRDLAKNWTFKQSRASRKNWN